MTFPSLPDADPRENNPTSSTSHSSLGHASLKSLGERTPANGRQTLRKSTAGAGDSNLRVKPSGLLRNVMGS